ncbi:phage tail tube protein [Paenibacillus polysaccharolyticus]|uniref:phage tail tube protein n=1 Tax=Paenibacillus polysaccharolyticus TaxID=582692 RepID=UPI00203C045E|nr:phage tail tube protein [Paenibacillus polysaccharolyticus]MCM3131902.1 phage tail tube protein [Paenibacillus polysaccharolyticus]
MAFFLEKDAISGKMATAFATINGQVEELFYAKSIEATIEMNKIDVPVLGKTNVPQRPAGWSGSGTLTVYYVSSLFRQMIRNYVKTGEVTYFDLQITNEQPGSDAGKQTAVLLGCNIDSIIAARFDATSDDMLDEEMPFTFNDYDLLDEFNQLS